MRNELFKTIYVGLLLLISAPLLASQVAGEDRLVIGVLQEQVEHRIVATEKQVESSFFDALRVLFIKDSDQWHAACYAFAPTTHSTCGLPDDAMPSKWWVRYEDKIKGTVTTKKWMERASISQEGLLEVSSQKVPYVGKRSSTFSGWVMESVHRPLLATSIPIPESGRYWKKIPPKTRYLSLIWPLFSTTVPIVDYCATDKNGSLLETERTLNREDIQLAGAWISKEGSRLFRANVKRIFTEKCDSILAHQTELWIFQARNGDLHLLQGQLGGNTQPKFELLDSADFDGDGQVESVFFYSGYNRDGFILVDSQFQNTVTYTWGYH